MTRMGECFAGERGFTLLEIMVALALVGIAFLALLQTDGLNSRRTLHAARLSGAVVLAQEAMEDVFASGTADLSDQEKEQDVYTVGTTVDATEFSGVDQVTVTVRWTEGSREESYDVVAYLPE